VRVLPLFYLNEGSPFFDFNEGFPWKIGTGEAERDELYIHIILPTFRTMMDMCTRLLHSALTTRVRYCTVYMYGPSPLADACVAQ
jgi:hypothetical protein